MIDLERIERKERKKGADPPDHPRITVMENTDTSVVSENCSIAADTGNLARSSAQLRNLSASAA